MTLDRIAQDAATELRTTTTHHQAPGPAAVVTRHRRRRAVAAFAAGAAVVAALFVVPIVLSGGPGEEDPAATTPPTSTVATTLPPPTTAAPTTPPTTPPASTTLAPLAPRAFSIPNLATQALPAERVEVVAQFLFGGRPFEVGVDEKGFGPCCFAVAADGTVVVADAANERVVAKEPGRTARVIAQWDAADFVPTGIALSTGPDEGIVFVLGQTNRPTQPHDLVSMRLDGTVIDRGPTDIHTNAALRVVGGQVWASAPLGADLADSPSPEWVPLATALGEIYDLGDQRPRGAGLPLPDTGTLTVSSPTGGGAVVARTGPGDIGGVEWELDTRTDHWGHWAVPYGDGVLVVAQTAGIGEDGATARVAAVLRDDGTTSEAITWTTSLAGDIGPFGILRVGRDGALYEMRMTSSHLQVVRIPLARARSFDSVVANAAGGWALATTTTPPGDVWILGDGRYSDARGEYAELLQVDQPTRTLLAVHPLPQPMHHLAIGSDAVWVGRAGDGGLPDNLVARLSPRTGALDVVDLGDISPVDIVAGDGALWLVTGRYDETGARLVRVDGATLRVEVVAALPSGFDPRALARHEDVLWIAGFDGSVVRMNTGGELLSTTPVTGMPIDIAIAADTTDRFGHTAWVAGRDGTVTRLSSQGAVEEVATLATTVCCLVSDAGAEQVWIWTDDGIGYVAAPDRQPETAVETPVREVRSVAQAGLDMWVLGDVLHVVEFGQ